MAAPDAYQNPFRVRDPLASWPTLPVARPVGQEVVVGGPYGGYTMHGGFLLAQVADEVVRQFGPFVYDLMAYDNACGTALYLLNAGALNQGVQLAPVLAADPGEDEEETAASNPERAAKLKLAKDVYEYCQRLVDANHDPIHDALWQFNETMLPQGSALAELVFTVAASGPDAGRRVLTKIRCKPRWAWAYVVDPFLGVDQIRAWTLAGWRDIEREHFMNAAFHPPDGDPRGQSVLKKAYIPWNLKLQVYPDYGEYLKRFATGFLIMKAGKDTVDKKVTMPDGTVHDFTVQEQMVYAGTQALNGSVVGLPEGADASIVHAVNSNVYDAAFDRFDREIFRSIILATRPVLEAKHGSKADSEEGTDYYQIACGEVRRIDAGAFRRDVLKRGVAYNWGERVAEELTPQVHFGAPESLSESLLQAFSNAWSKGLFLEAQRPWVWNKLSAPVPQGWEEMAERERAHAVTLAGARAASAGSAPPAGAAAEEGGSEEEGEGDTSEQEAGAQTKEGPAAGGLTKPGVKTPKKPAKTKTKAA